MNRLIFYSLFICLLLPACKETVVPAVTVEEVPVLFPDYVGVTVPSTIAPLNFTVNEPHTRLDVVVEGVHGEPLHIQQAACAQFPPARWTALLAENVGESLHVTVSIRQEEGWKQFAPFTIHVSAAPIDQRLVYRLIAPGYEIYSKMGIYERDLSSFAQEALLENTLLPGSCVNCHSFCGNDPTQMSLHLRGAQGGTVLMQGNRTELLNTQTNHTLSACVYPYWHPSGRYIAYSVNKTQQAFHAVKEERVEVVDLSSDIVVYDVKRNELITPPVLAAEGAFETFPSFSPDGRTLYFCSAIAREIPADYKEVRYDLCRIDFNPEEGTFGSVVDTLVFAAAAGKSISFPRPSPDGLYIMYTLSDYGNFSIWHREANLWLLTLADTSTRILTEVNSPEVESYHSWSSNSRWFVFSSRRDDGLYTRPYLASVDEAGRIGKPFLLPQEDPAWYDRTFYSFNIPEFVTAPVHLDARSIEQQALSGKRKQVGVR